MNFFSKLIGLFKKDKAFDKKAKLIVDEYGDLSVSLISFSDASYMSSFAAKMCVGAPVEEDYDKRLGHISRVISRGHESTIAHSNIIMLVLLDSAFNSKFIEIAPALKFAEYVTSEQEDGSNAILIGGSVRAYKYFFREVKDLSNPICNAIKETLYQSAESAFFEDFIADGLMDKAKFQFYPIANTNVVSEEVADADGEKYMQDYCEATVKAQNILKGKVCDIAYADDVLGILDKVEGYGFTLRDILKLTTCTVIFHDISRIISQQLTRHLAGIAQESQRYVDYSTAKFIDPTQFNKKYDMTKNYKIEIGLNKYEMSSTELGKMLLLIYPQLVAQGMLKQDARGFLVQNGETKLVMTFTLSNLIHFIKERKPNVAQPEAQYITNDMIEGLYKYEATTYLFSSIGVDGLINICETPVYKAKEGEDLAAIENSIDEIISEEEI